MSDLSDRKFKVKQPLYFTWRRMIRRCNEANYEYYHRYGGRGIKVCEAWKDYFAFERDVGPKPGKNYSLDRIDNNGDYCPSNIRWATQKQQCNNRSTNRPITMNGETKNLIEWCNDIGMSAGGVLDRVKRGWPIEEALTHKKIRSRHHRVKKHAQDS